ncbi:hypothetical protein [Actinoplanes subtropicus]|uniref:hypothetical protein n=1 Tax=Actinoplanes subtropicus TaxID=543632 RepID=UPI0004C2B8A1|nr:hypothetical protein [Actinoplanes subtropicus]
MTKHLLRRAALVAAVTASGLVAAAPAQAATTCSGTVSYDGTVSRGGSVIGELVIYYNTSNGGTNSACFYHRGAAYGGMSLTGVQIARCSQRSGEGKTCDIAALSAPDEGDYKYYAGPVGVTGTANYCVAARGYLQWGTGNVYVVDSGTQGC